MCLRLFSIGNSTTPWGIVSNNPCLSIKLADVGGEGVQVMEDGIVGGAWYAFYFAHIFWMPWGETAKLALCFYSPKKWREFWYFTFISYLCSGL